MTQKDIDYLENGIKFRRVALVNGKFVKTPTEALVGYCRCNLHRGYLDVTLLNQHGCIDKNCVFLDKFENYPFWIKQANREKSKILQKEARKRKQKNAAAHKAKTENKMEHYRKTAQILSDRLNFPIIIARVVPKTDQKNNYEYIINYVSDDLCNDWRQYFDLAVFMSHSVGGKFELRRMRLPNGGYASISDWNNRKNK